ncbi:replication initiation factor domain-containing protein, partial [Rhodanobacter thiooxydans]
EKRGDWDMPELGRTQYLGASSSAVRARLYEKGKQPEFRHLSRFDLCRLEIQVRPAKDAKDAYSKLSALEVWGASKWTRQLASE